MILKEKRRLEGCTYFHLEVTEDFHSTIRSTFFLKHMYLLLHLLQYIHGPVIGITLRPLYTT
jgi:hypothetical protein